MKITLVKKILEDGSPCKKCADVMDKLQANDQMQYIDRVVDADERDPDSEGVAIARQYDVDRAPFFVVEREGQEAQIYTVYFKFVKEVLEAQGSEREELKEIMDDNPDLYFL